MVVLVGLVISYMENFRVQLRIGLERVGACYGCMGLGQNTIVENARQGNKGIVWGVLGR